MAKNINTDKYSIYDSNTATELTASDLGLTRKQYVALIRQSLSEGTAEGHTRTTDGRKVYAA